MTDVVEFRRQGDLQAIEPEGPAHVHCLNFVPHRSGTLLGFCDLHVPKWKLKIYGCPVHQRGQSRWLQLPAKPITDRSGEPLRGEDGKARYQPILEFDNLNIQRLFSDLAIAALPQYDATIFAADDVGGAR